MDIRPKILSSGKKTNCLNKGASFKPQNSHNLGQIFEKRWWWYPTLPEYEWSCCLTSLIFDRSDTGKTKWKHQKFFAKGQQCWTKMWPNVSFVWAIMRQTPEIFFWICTFGPWNQRFPRGSFSALRSVGWGQNLCFSPQHSHVFTNQHKKECGLQSIPPTFLFSH